MKQRYVCFWLHNGFCFVKWEKDVGHVNAMLIHWVNFSSTELSIRENIFLIKSSSLALSEYFVWRG